MMPQPIIQGAELRRGQIICPPRVPHCCIAHHLDCLPARSSSLAPTQQSRAACQRRAKRLERQLNCVWLVSQRQISQRPFCVHVARGTIQIQLHGNFENRTHLPCCTRWRRRRRRRRRRRKRRWRHHPKESRHNESLHNSGEAEGRCSSRVNLHGRRWRG